MLFRRKQALSKQILNRIISDARKKPRIVPVLHALPTSFVPLDSLAHKRIYLTSNAMISKEDPTDVLTVKGDLLSVSIGYAGLGSEDICQEVVRRVSRFKVSTHPAGANFLEHLKLDHDFATTVLLFLAQKAVVEREVMVRDRECTVAVYISLRCRGFQFDDQLRALSVVAGADRFQIRVSAVDKSGTDEMSHWLLELRKTLPAVVCPTDLGAAEAAFREFKNITPI